MTYADREEAYKAGREGRSIHTAHVNAYEDGQRDRKRARDRARDRDADAPRGGGEAILLVLALAAVGAIVAVALVSAVAAIAAAVVVAVAARIPPRATSPSYAEAYKAGFYAFGTWLTLTSVLGFGALAIQDGQPGAWYALVRDIARTFNEGGAYIVTLPISWVPWPGGVVPPTPAAPVDLGTGALLVLIAPAWIGAAIALGMHVNFGLLRASIAVPFVVGAGVTLAVGVLVGVMALALRADTPPIGFDAELASIALLAIAAACLAAVVFGLLGGLVGAAVTAALSLGKRFPLGYAMRSTGGAVLASCLTTAIALFLFRQGDGFAAVVRESASARQFFLPDWTVVQAFLPLAMPGVLLGGSLLRGALPLGGFAQYLLACVLFAPLAVVADAAALGGAFVAFDSANFVEWLR